MRKALLFLIIAATCLAVAFRYFGPDLSWITDASDEPNGPIAELDRPLPHAAAIAEGDSNIVLLERLTNVGRE